MAGVLFLFSDCSRWQVLEREKILGEGREPIEIVCRGMMGSNMLLLLVRHHILLYRRRIYRRCNYRSIARLLVLGLESSSSTVRAKAFFFFFYSIIIIIIIKVFGIDGTRSLITAGIFYTQRETHDTILSSHPIVQHLSYV